MKRIYIFDTSDKRNEYAMNNLKLKSEIVVDFNDLLADKTQLVPSENEDASIHDCCPNIDDFQIIYILSPAFKFENSQLPLFASKSFVFYYKADKEFLDKLSDKNIQTKCIMSDEQYVCKNSMLTAEGALMHAINETDKSLSDQNILILGFGHLGKALVATFKSLSTNLSIATDDVVESGVSSIFNVPSLTLEEAFKRLKEFDLIINTIPAKVFIEIPQFKENALVLELASKNYPFDYERLSVRYKILGALPAKTSFCSAGELLLEKITE